MAPWRCLLIDPTSAPTHLRAHGLVVVEGALTVTGDWEISGLLIGLGPILVAGGRLHVRGGLLGDPDLMARPGPGLTIHPELAAVDRALAVVGRPARAPFHLRQRLP